MTEQPENTLKEELTAALKSARESSEVVVDKKEVAADANINPEDSLEVAADGKKDDVEEKGDALDDKEFPLVPKDWSVEERRVFEDLLSSPDTAEGAAILLERYNSLLKGFHKDRQSLKSAAKQAEEWNSIFTEEQRQELSASGMDERKYVKGLIDQVVRAKTDPSKFVLDLIDYYKINPQQLGFNTNEAAEDIDDDLFSGESRKDTKVGALEKELKELREAYNELPEKIKRDMAQTSEVQRINQEINSFAEAKDAEGNLLHPYFEQLKTTMGFIMQKQDVSMAEAYKKALAIEGLGVSDIELARLKAANAQKSSRSISSRSGLASDYSYSEGSLKDELLARLQRSKAV